MQMNQSMTPEMRQCIQNCLQCHAACEETKMHCLMMGGEHAAAQHQRTMADCAQACLTSADFMLRMSPHHSDYCRTCADLCAECASDCERLAGGDETMLRCAELCRKCEKSCREMALTTA